METLSVEGLKRENQRLYTVLEINAILSGSLRLDMVLNTLLEKTRELCLAEASSLMLFDEATQELFFHTIQGTPSETLKGVRLGLGEGIAGWVIQNGKPVLVADCKEDARFSRKADQKSRFETRTMMCVPLIVKERGIGTIQVLNRLDFQPFDQSDLRILHVLANQAAVAIQNARLHEMATVDGMTGLYLRNYFMARLEEEYRRVLRTGEPVSLLMSDIDFFKKVNDKYGHQGGDMALIGLAKVIQDTILSLDSEDMAGRYGGEEFCILLPGRDENKAQEIGELVRKNIESQAIAIGEQKANITISVGVSSFPLHTDHLKSPDDFIKLADEALYICKNKGRNCVSLYEEKSS